MAIRRKTDASTIAQSNDSRWQEKNSPVNKKTLMEHFDGIIFSDTLFI
ncbi:hypothetical protein [Calothrix sp. NIES-3974]|nr:hypothetical protein [Calothrix sp. NIES-3974]